MFNLYGNDKLLDTFNTIEECEIAKKDYKEIERAIYGRTKIKYEIVKGA